MMFTVRCVILCEGAAEAMQILLNKLFYKKARRHLNQRLFQKQYIKPQSRKRVLQPNFKYRNAISGHMDSSKGATLKNL